MGERPELRVIDADASPEEVAAIVGIPCATVKTRMFYARKKLAQLVKDKVPGSTPELVCLDPVEKRTLDIDLKTGELRK